MSAGVARQYSGTPGGSRTTKSGSSWPTPHGSGGRSPTGITPLRHARRGPKQSLPSLLLSVANSLNQPSGPLTAAESITLVRFHQDASLTDAVEAHRRK